MAGVEEVENEVQDENDAVDEEQTAQRTAAEGISKRLLQEHRAPVHNKRS